MTSEILSPKLSPSSHPVLDLIKSRRAYGSGRAPGDNASLAIVIEGGGMRGVVAGGMVIGLQELGISPSMVDMVVGTSAGSMTGAYYLADQTESGTSIYYEDLVDKEWLDFRRAAKGQPVLGLEYLVHEVMVNRKPLKWERVLQHQTPLIAVTTELPDFKPVSLSGFRSPEELREAMMASARVPLFSGKPYSIGSSRYLDGAETQPIPIQTAIKNGATHILALLTRPEGVQKTPPTNLEKRILFPLVSRLIPGLGKIQEQKPDKYNEVLSDIIRLTQESPTDMPMVYGIRIPTDGPNIKQLEQDPVVLKSGADAGRLAVHEILG